MTSHTARFSVLDHLLPYTYTTMHFCFASDNPDQSVECLRRGLNKTVQQLPFLSGQIYHSSEPPYPDVISWTDGPAPIELEELSIPNLQTYQQLAQNGMPLHLLSHSLLPHEARTFGDRSSHTALAVCCVRLEGGLIVTISTHHRLMDGSGRQIFYEILASNTRNESSSCSIDPLEPLLRAERFDKLVGTVSAERRDSSSSTDVWEEGVSKPPVVPSNDNVPPLEKRFLRFSVSKLKMLSHILSNNSESAPSTNTTCSAVLWYLISRARLDRIKKSKPDQKESEETSTLIMATDMRKKFIAKGMLEKNSWMGNLVTGCMPPPKLSLDTFTEHQLEGSTYEGKRLTIPSCLSGLAATISSCIASSSVESFQQVFSPLVSASHGGDFDFRTLQRGKVRAGYNSWTVYVTNGASFDFYQDFGPNLGKPQFLRMGVGGINGLCMMLPRKFDDSWSQTERDTLEVMVYLREDDMEAVMANPLLNELLLGPPQ